MGGLPRYMYPSGLSLNILFIKLIGPFWGYVLSKFLVCLVAFAGVYMLIRTYVFKEIDSINSTLIASIFTLIPFFTAFGITVSGLPLLVYIFLNILNKRSSYWEYVFILLFPFYSSIIWGAPFINLVLIITFFLKKYETKPKIKFIAFITLMNIVYLLVNYNLIYNFSGISDIPLHREEYNPFLEWNGSFGASIVELVYIFFMGHYHVGMLFTIPIFVLSLLAFKNQRIRLLILAAVIIAFVNGFYLHLVPVLERIHPFLVSFVIKRVNVLLPFIWILILVISISELTLSWQKSVTRFILINMLIIGLFVNDEITNNYKIFFNINTKPGYKQFLSSNLFNGIKEKLNSIEGEDSYYIGSLGISPSIAQFNGFNCIDGISSVYPLAHKHNILRIQENELKKDTMLFNYFNAWGNRCYLFSSELGYEHNAFMISKNEDITINNWSINSNTLNDMDVRYILSTVRINNTEENRLNLIDTGIDKDSFWKVYIYSIN